MARRRHAPLKRPEEHNKLARLPKGARVTKRPLHRPPIPSPYTSSATAKVVYVSAKTPFVGALKRVQKLLQLADKRLVQSATTLQKKSAQDRKRKRADHEDEVQEIVRIVERRKKAKVWVGDDAGSVSGTEHAAAEEVMIKASGKAVDKALQLAVWFQQRHDQYAVRLRTSSAMAIDDIEVDENVAREEQRDIPGEAQEGESAAQVDSTMKREPLGHAPHGEENSREVLEPADRMDEGHGEISQIPESRLRYTSVIEIAISLR